MSFSAHAQQDAIKALADGHYIGARQQFEHFVDNVRGEDSRIADAEGLMLICDYVLDRPCTAKLMSAWIGENKKSQYAGVVNILMKLLTFSSNRRKTIWFPLLCLIPSRALLAR